MPANAQRFRVGNDDRFLQIVSADPEANRASDIFHLVNRLLNCERAAIVRFRCNTHAAIATSFTKRRRPQMTAIRRRIWKRHDRQPAKMVMNSARRNLN